MKTQNQTNDRILKRTEDGKRVLTLISASAQAFTEKLIKKYQSQYLQLWRKEDLGTLTDSERLQFKKIDRVLGKARNRESKNIGTW
jgi:hypothetical protein